MSLMHVCSCENRADPCDNRVSGYQAGKALLMTSFPDSLDPPGSTGPFPASSNPAIIGLPATSEFCDPRTSQPSLLGAKALP